MSHTDYSYASTRVSILADRLIAPERWSELLNSNLQQLLDNIDCELNKASRQNLALLEQCLIETALTDFRLLFRPFHGIERAFLDYAVRWYELANLKALIRGKYSNTDENSISQQLIDLGDLTDLPVKQLLEAEDTHELLRLLDDTAYAGIVSQARHNLEEENADLFTLDAAIDRNFFVGLIERLRFLKQVDQLPMHRVFGSLMDRFNLMWLLRYRFSYGLSPAKSYYLLSTTGHALPSSSLMQMARLDSLDEVIQALPDNISSMLAECSNMTEIDNLMELYALSAARKGLFQQESALTRVFSYVLLRESQVKTLQAIIKGKTLGFAPNLINIAIGGNQ